MTEYAFVRHHTQSGAVSFKLSRVPIDDDDVLLSFSFDIVTAWPVESKKDMANEIAKAFIEAVEAAESDEG